MKRAPAERASILDQFRVADRWARAERKWQQHMLAQLDAGDTNLSQRYGAICAEELERRAAGGTDDSPALPPPDTSGLPTAAPAGDFRADVMQGAPPSRPAAQQPVPAGDAPHGSLAEQMRASDEVHAPAGGQDQTAASTVKPRQAMAMLRWEVERYAELCHAMSNQERQAEVLASHGIDTLGHLPARPEAVGRAAGQRARHGQSLRRAHA